MTGNILFCPDADNAVRWREGERLEHLFEARADRSLEDKLAVITEETDLTFKELDARANQAARYLLDQGLKAGDRIGVLFDKSIHGYIGLLAVLKIGAAYVPLDASFPEDRIAYIIEDAGMRAIVSVTRFTEKLSAFDIESVFLDEAENAILARSIARLTDEEKTGETDPLFYIIYTSGTTGKPKGVAIDHAGICNFVRVAGEVYGINDQDRAYQGMTLAFDFHVEDLWVPLIAGATLISGRSGVSLFGADLHAFLSEKRITVFPCVPTLWATIEEDLPDVRVILLSGEDVPHHLVVRWHREGRRILNAYGPTECSVSSTLRVLEPSCPVTIGTPLPTYTAVILGEHEDKLAPEGEIGEIGIAGVALARGYLNREELTAKKFIPDFLNLPNNPSRKIYRTGDYGSIREDGELDFHGRIDTQIKIRGYRVELGEIEAVLMQSDEIAHTVVNPYESEPGALELVAYYTRKPGAPDVSRGDITKRLKSHLPGYMIPGYLEELPAIPMTANNKADRKALPPPKGPRLALVTSNFEPPSTDTERSLAEMLAEVLSSERISIQDNFFQDLGAHSLLMARYGAAIRERLKIATVSMQDIYLNPTIAQLAEHLDKMPRETVDEAAIQARRDAFHIPSRLSYYGCAALQIAWGTAWGLLGLWLLVEGIFWTYEPMPDLATVYGRIIVFGLSLALIFSILPVAVKWLLIGRWKAEEIPIWSFGYFRFWAMKSLLGSAPLAYLGDPFYNAYLRLLGAKIGKHVVLHGKGVPVCTDLVSIGDNSVISNEAILRGYKARANVIHTGSVEIGADCFVGEHGVLDIDTVMEDGTQLGYASSLHEGQRIPAGKHYHGCDAVETEAEFCPIEPMECTTLRRWTYPSIFIGLGFLLGPIPLMFVYLLFPAFWELVGGSTFAYDNPWPQLQWLTSILLPLIITLVYVFTVVGLISIAVFPRLFNLFLKPDKTYILYGLHYFFHRIVKGSSNSSFYNSLFGDSSAIPHYCRWIGYRMNRIIQTGSNFGMEQRHDNPFLCDFGSGTMVSADLKMINETTSNSSFKLSMTKVGRNSYLGNYLHFPTSARVGENVLVATKALVPIDGPIRENVGLLGSPPFEIPRANERDLEISKIDDETLKQQLRLKNRYNFVTGLLYLLNTGFMAFFALFPMLVGLLYFPKYGMPSLYVAGMSVFAFVVFWSWLVERGLMLGFGRLSPKVVSMLKERYFWFHERHWKMIMLKGIGGIFVGTPMKNIFTRLQGVKMGRMVFDDGVDIDETTLVAIGDYTNLNAASVIQPHSLEEGVFKSDYVKIGKGCTLGVASNIHYGVDMGDHVEITTDSFVMKGEILDPDTVWSGNPAKVVQTSAIAAGEPEKAAPGDEALPVKEAASA
ncbi:MAG: Pls/PosA family non-ribosomal peptide synthetase [Geminicoccaceae bacterium]